MAEDNELEKRAVEELLRETDRARVRAETMGPGGWLKCPLRSTNKRFLLNTLRSTGLQRRPSEPRGHAGHPRRQSSETSDRSRDHSRSPPRDHKSNGGHTDQKNHHRDRRNNADKKEDRDKERSHRHRHRDRDRDRDRRRGEDGQKRQ